MNKSINRNLIVFTTVFLYFYFFLPVFGLKNKVLANYTRCLWRHCVKNYTSSSNYEIKCAGSYIDVPGESCPEDLCDSDDDCSEDSCFIKMKMGPGIGGIDVGCGQHGCPLYRKARKIEVESGNCPEIYECVGGGGSSPCGALTTLANQECCDALRNEISVYMFVNGETYDPRAYKGCDVIVNYGDTVNLRWQASSPTIPIIGCSVEGQEGKYFKQLRYDPMGVYSVNGSDTDNITVSDRTTYNIHCHLGGTDDAPYYCCLEKWGYIWDQHMQVRVCVEGAPESPSPASDSTPSSNQGTGTCNYDINGDGTRDVNDILEILQNWGNPYTIQDILGVLENWGDC